MCRTEIFSRRGPEMLDRLLGWLWRFSAWSWRPHGSCFGWLWQSSAWSWRPHGSRFGGFHEHLEFSEFKIWVTDLLRRSVLKDVSNEITVQVGSKEALCRVYDPPTPKSFPGWGGSGGVNNSSSNSWTSHTPLQPQGVGGYIYIYIYIYICIYLYIHIYI